MSNLNPIKVKFLFEDELRAISLKNLRFEELQQSLETALGVSTSSCLLLRYVDNEGETVTIGSDPELQEAAQTYKDKSLKLIVQKTDKPQLHSLEVAESDKSESTEEVSAEVNGSKDLPQAEKANPLGEEVEEVLFPSKAEKQGEKKLLQRELKRAEKNNRKEVKREKQRNKNMRKQEEKMVKRAMKQKMKGVEESRPVISQEVHDSIIELENLLELQREKRNRDVQILKKEISQKKEQLHEIKRENKLKEEALKLKIKELKSQIKLSNDVQTKVEADCEPEIKEPKEVPEERTLQQEEVKEKKEEHPQIFQVQIEQLTSMGFIKQDINLALLYKHNGNLAAVVDELVSM
eukprot:TRINITY_DN1829_c0_g1_i1.p1 TRINITY_DN1829_c0_g1~~TRINITY_DN1829_c0_g1_i1.p1  ORF type:complete len:350 (-),score=102.11 TRINITY_DN1829_c0_g1_i1:59-1108(-)